MTAPARTTRTNGPRHGAPRRPRRGVRIAAGVAAVVLGTSGVGHAVVSGIDSRIGRVDVFRGLSNRPVSGQGTNLLVVGTDSRDRITEEERRLYHLGGAPCHCTDTVMLVHLSADHDRATVVSLPRDTYSEIPEHVDEAGRPHPTHVQKLNAAYAEGGPGLTVRTVEHLTGVHIDHYLEVDFTSFMKTVDEVGGVRLCTDRPLQDPFSGLNLPVGTSTLNGGQALEYVRSRHLDGAADLGRMQRQQRFVAALLHRVSQSGVLLNPVMFQQVADTLLGSVRADRGLDSGELIGLGQAMRNLTPAATEFLSVPIASANFPVPRVGSTVKWDDVASARLFQALREDRPLTAHTPSRLHDAKAPSRRQEAPTPVEVAPSEVRVQVYNGSGRQGLARAADLALRAMGFSTTGLPTDAAAGPAQARTVIAYDPRWDRSVRSLAAAFPTAELRPAPGQGPLMRVTLGTDFTTVHEVRERAAPRRGGPEVMTGDRAVCP
ncbi:LCP family protein [Streptomyces sp. NPDC051162]|uniref:LCP family protein n=1 Tax=unclassified Streptomyces TaxID=2593676 RepID=UPI0034487B99